MRRKLREWIENNGRERLRVLRASTLNVEGLEYKYSFTSDPFEPPLLRHIPFLHKNVNKTLFLIARKKIRPSQPLYSPRTYTRYQNPPRTKQSNLLLPPTEVLTPPTSETTSAGLKVYVSLKVLSCKMHSAHRVMQESTVSSFPN